MSKKLRPIHPGADLVGMFLVLDTTDHEHYRVGHIAAAVGNCYLIQFDKLEEKDPLPPMELYTLDELSRTCENCGQKLANLFETLCGNDGVDRLAQRAGEAVRTIR